MDLGQLARQEGGRLLALLMGRFGDLHLAEDALQEAFAKATGTWVDGVPDNPAAWLYTVARNAGIDRLRRDSVLQGRLASDARVLQAGVADGAVHLDTGDPSFPLEGEVGDERLRLMLLCCHPALSRDSQVALTLRLAGGLTTREIAAAFVVDEATLAQRLSRAKRKIRDAGIPLTVPDDLDQRASLLGDVLALIFNEGYLSHGGEAHEAGREALADSAIAMTAAAADALPDTPDLGGLLALQLLQRARQPARFDAGGVLVTLTDQDRSLWDRRLMARGFRAVTAATSTRRLGPWTLRAMIEAEHATAPTYAETNWPRIVRYYDMLQVAAPSEVTSLNRAVAVAEAGDPKAALDSVEQLTSLAGYYLWHSTRADLLERAGDTAAAAAAWNSAARLTDNSAERGLIQRRLERLGRPA